MEDVKDLTQKALNGGELPESILKDGLIKAMDKIGVKFKNNEIYIPEVLIAARAMHAGLGGVEAHSRQIYRIRCCQDRPGNGERGSARHRQKSGGDDVGRRRF